jgi:hypothetical protein
MAAQENNWFAVAYDADNVSDSVFADLKPHLSHFRI